MFTRTLRNSRARLALELMTGVAACVFVGVAVLNPIDAYFNTSIFGGLGWLEYTFFGACGMTGWYFWGKARKS
ncbi:MAG: hypothetical protein OXL96_28395 [Candidatus Poribacteria bacterium]|nr:hypothetical protein [Candidatus Poribacteria bacterium]